MKGEQKLGKSLGFGGMDEDADLSGGLDAFADEDDNQDPGQQEAEAEMPADLAQVGYIMLGSHGQQCQPVMGRSQSRMVL